MTTIEEIRARYGLEADLLLSPMVMDLSLVWQYATPERGFERVLIREHPQRGGYAKRRVKIAVQRGYDVWRVSSSQREDTLLFEMARELGGKCGPHWSDDFGSGPDNYSIYHQVVVLPRGVVPQVGDCRNAEHTAAFGRAKYSSATVEMIASV